MFLILVAALSIRIWGIGFGLPHIYHPDEQKIVTTALGFGTGDMNPHFFKYPTLYIYIQFLLFGITYAIGTLAGAFASATDFAVKFYQDPTVIYTVGRVATALFGTGLVYLSYLTAKRIFSPKTALLASLFAAFSLILVQDSHFITTDVPMAFFFMLSAYFAVVHSQTHTWRSIMAAALFCGLAASTKYNGGIAILPILIAAWISIRKREEATKLLLLAKTVAVIALLSLGGFLIGTPYALVDFAAFKSDLLFELSHASKGHFGFQTTMPVWLFHLLISLGHGVGYPLLIIGILGMAISVLRGKPEEKILALFAAFYFLMLSVTDTYFQRYAIPLAPLLCIFAAGIIAKWFDKGGVHRYLSLVYALVFALLPCIAASVTHDLILSRPDTRTLAKTWIEKNIPENSVILLDSYGPPLVPVQTEDTGHENVKKAKAAIKKLARKPGVTYRIINITSEGGKMMPDWVKSQCPDYIITSSFISDRIKARVASKGMENPFYSWLEDGTKYVQSFTPYGESEKPFNMKEIYSPSRTHLFTRYFPGPAIHIYDPELNCASPTQ